MYHAVKRMKLTRVNKYLSSVVVLVGLIIILIPFGLIFGMSLLPNIIFWFFVVPFLAFSFGTKICISQDQMFASLTGLLLFYGFMVFMIYEHYQSDFFKLMLLSMVTGIPALIIKVREKRKQLTITNISQ